jgi:hypothetical protein
MEVSYANELEEADSNAWGHDYFFPPRDLIPWKLPEKEDDIRRLFIEPPDISDDLLQEFGERATYFIKGGVQKPFLDDVDFLSMFNNKSTFNWQAKRSTTSYEARIGKKIREASTLRFKYAWVQKNACEARSCLVGTPETICAIKSFHKMFKAVVCCPENEFYNPNVAEGWKIGSHQISGMMPSMSCLILKSQA